MLKLSWDEAAEQSLPLVPGWYAYASTRYVGSDMRRSGTTESAAANVPIAALRGRGTGRGNMRPP